MPSRFQGQEQTTSTRSTTNMAAWIAAALAIVGLLRESTSFNLVAEPKFQEVKNNATLQIMCQADVPLTACQAGKGGNYISYSTLESNSTTYWDSGLANGQCGYSDTVPQTPGSSFVYGCRVRDHKGEWQYATSASYWGGSTAAPTETPDNSLNGILSVETPPAKMIVQPGADVELVYTATEALSECSFKVKWLEESLTNGSTSEYSIDNSGLALGRCRLTLHNVTAEKSGVVKSHIKSIYNNGKRRHFIDVTTVIATRAPSTPVLTFVAQYVLSDEDVMEASCRVDLARPVARITWLLNDDVILGEPEDFEAERWDYQEAEVTRTVKVNLTLTDEAQELVCRVHHEALPEGFVDVKSMFTAAEIRATKHLNSDILLEI